MREGRGELGEQFGPLDRDAADHDAGHASREVVAGRLERADAAAELAGNAGCLHHPGDEPGLRRLAVAGAVEIDDVQPAGSGGHEAAGHFDGIVAEDGLAGVVALQQPHALAPTEIDRGPEFHGAACLRVGAVGSQVDASHSESSRSPAAWLFSGWNWVANIRPRRTAAQNGPP